MTAGNVPYIFAANTTIVSAQVNADFAALVTDLNGIDTGQITAGTLSIARIPIITLAKGGTGADLSATGPGLLQQASNASVVSIVAAGQITGTATNDSAAAGKIGEYMTSASSTIGLVSGASSLLTNVTLTAGDWDVSGFVDFVSISGSAVTYIAADVNTSGATNDRTTLLPMPSGVAGSPFATLPTTVVRFSVASPTTVSLLALSVWIGGGGVSAYGAIRARRAR